MEDIIPANEQLNDRCETEGINYYEGIEALGFLFKYAVPRARYYNYAIESVKLYPHFGGEDVWLADITMEQVDDRYSAECKVFTGKDKDPALALFWALHSLIDKTPSL